MKKFELKPVSLVCVLVGLWMMFGSGISFDIPWINIPWLVDAGPKSVLIVYETGDSTPQFSQTLVSLRKEHESYLKEKGHFLDALDDDSVDENGQPAKVIEAWKSEITGKKLPVIIITSDAKNPAGGKLVHGASLSKGYETPANEIMDIVKSHGG